MTTTVFFKKAPGQIGQLVLDATITETHNLSATITSSPVETGKKISDNIVNDPDSVTMEGFVTNSPVKVLGGLLDGNVDSQDRVQTAYDTLCSLRANKTLITAVTSLKIYKNMAFKTLTTPKTPQTGDAIHFTAELVKIDKVSSQTVNIPREKTSANKSDQAQSTTDAGQQDGQQPNSQQQAQGQSWAVDAGLPGA